MNFTADSTIQEFLDFCNDNGLKVKLENGTIQTYDVDKYWNIAESLADIEYNYLVGKLFVDLGFHNRAYQPRFVEGTVTVSNSLSVKVQQTISLDMTMSELGMTKDCVSIYKNTGNSKFISEVERTYSEVDVWSNGVMRIGTALNAEGGLVSGRDYAILDINDFYELQNYVNHGGSTNGVNIWLVNDIDLSDLVRKVLSVDSVSG